VYTTAVPKIITPCSSR